MDVYKLDGCCGIREISGISDYNKPEDTIKVLVDDDLLNELDNAPFVILSAVTQMKGSRKKITYGPVLRDYILANNLGEVVETGVHTNPNSGNKLQVYVWTPNYKALGKLAEKYEKEEKNDTGCGNKACTICY